MIKTSKINLIDPSNNQSKEYKKQIRSFCKKTLHFFFFILSATNILLLVKDHKPCSFIQINSKSDWLWWRFALNMNFRVSTGFLAGFRVQLFCSLFFSSIAILFQSRQSDSNACSLLLLAVFALNLLKPAHLSFLCSDLRQSYCWLLYALEWEQFVRPLSFSFHDSSSDHYSIFNALLNPAQNFWSASHLPRKCTSVEASCSFAFKNC